MAKKKRKRLSKTILVYILTFIVVTFATAFLTVTVNYDNYMLNNSSNLMGNMGATDSSALSSTISNLMGISCGAVNVNMTAEGKNGENLDVDCNIKLKMDNGIDSLECSVDVVLYLNGKPFVLRLAVANSMIYMSINESNFKFESKGLVNTIAGVLGIVGMGMDGASSIAGMFDMNALMGMASGIKEVATENGTSLQINDANMNVSMNVDDNYMLQSVDIGSISVGGYTATGAVTMTDINSNNITVEPPLQESVYEDISVPMRLFSALSGIVSNDFRAKANINALGTRLTTEVIYDKQTNIGKVGMGAGAIGFDVYLAGGNFYLTSGNAKIKAADLSATSFVAGLGVLFSEINSINQENGNGFAFDTSMITDLDLTGLGDVFKMEGDVISAEIEGQKIYFTMEGDKISHITLNGDVDVTVKLDYADQNLFFNDFGYVALEKMSWVLEPITNFMTTRKFSTSIDYTYGDLSGRFMLRVDLLQRRAIQLNTELFGKNFEIIVDGDYILLNIDGEYSKIKSSEVGFLALAIFDKLGGQIEIGTAFDIEQVLNSAMNLIYADENALMFKGNGSLLQYASDGNILYNGNINGEKFNLFVSIDKVARDIRDYNLKFYSDFVFTSTLALNAKEYIENKVYNFTLSGLYEGHSVAADVFADLANNRYVLDINFAGQTVGVILQDDVYYISYRQFKFFGDAESAFTMLAGAVALGAGDVNFANQIESLSKEMISVASNIDIVGLVTDVKIKDISLKQGEFAISMEKLAGLEDVLDIENIKLSVKAQDEHLKELKVEYGTSALTLGFSRDVVAPLTEEQKALYHISIDDLLEFGKNTFEYINGGRYAFNISAAYDDISLNGRLFVTKTDIQADFIISVKNEKVFVKVTGGKVYINYYNIALSAGIEDVGVALGILNKLGVKLPQINIEESVNKLLAASDVKLDQTTLCRILSAIDVDLINFDYESSSYILGYDDYYVFVDATDNMFGGISTEAFGASIDVDVIDEFDVELLGDYVALGDLFKLGFFTYNYINAGDYKFDILATYDAYSVQGVVGYNAGETLASLDINIAGAHVYVKLVDSKLYVNYANLAFVGELADIAKLSAILAEFGLNVDVEEVASLLESVTATFADLSIDDMLSGFDANKVILTEKDGVFTFDYDTYSVIVVAPDGEVKSLSTAIAGANVNIELIDKVAVTLTGDYVSVGELLDFGKSVYDFATSGDYKFAVSVMYDSYSVSGFVAFKENKLLADLVLDINGNNVALKVTGGKLYVNYANLAFVGELEDVAKLSAILAEFGFNVNTDEIVELLGSVKSSLDIEIIKAELSKFDINNLYLTHANEIYTITYGDYSLQLKANKNALSGLKVSEFGAVVDVNIVENVTVTPASDYVSVGDLLDFGKSIYDFATSGDYKFAISAMYDSYSVSGFVGFNANEILADLDLKIGLEHVYLKVKNGKLFVNFRQFAFVGELEDVAKLSAVLASFGLDVDMSEMVEVLGALTSSFDKIDIDKQLGSFDINNLTLTQVGDKLTLGYGEYFIDFNTNQNKISGISTTVMGASFGLQIVDSINVEPLGHFISIGNLISLVDNTIDYVNSNSYILGVNADYDSYKISGGVSVVSGALLANLVITVQNEEIYVKVKEGKIYLDYANLKFSTCESDITLLVNLLGKLGIDVANNQVTQMIGATLELSKTSISKENMLALVKAIDIDSIVFNEASDVYNIGYGDYVLNVKTQDNAVTGISAGAFGVNFNIYKVDAVDCNVVGDYVALGDLMKVALNEIDYVKGNIAFGLDLTLEGFDIDGKMFFDGNTISSEISMLVLGEPLIIKFIGDTLYIDLNGLKIKGASTDYESLAWFIEKYTGVTLPSIYNFKLQAVLETYTDIVKFANEMIGVTLPDAPSENDIGVSQNVSILQTLKKISLVNSANGFRFEFDGFGVDLFVNNNSLTNIKLDMDNANVDVYKTSFEKLEVKPQSFIKAGEIISLLDKTTTTLSTRAMQGIINLDFMFEGRKHQVDIDYNIDFTSFSDIRGKIDFTFKGVHATIYYMQGILFMDIAGLKLKVPLREYREINRFIESRFNINTGLDSFINDLFKEIESFDFIKSWIINDDYAKFGLNEGLGIYLDFVGDKINTVTFSQGTVNAKISLIPKETVDLSGDYSTYHSYTRVFDMIDSVLALGNREGFDVHADAFVYEGAAKRFNIDIDLAFSIKDVIKAYGEADVLDGNGNVLYDNVIGALDNQRIYVDFEGLKLQIQQQSLMELLVVALSALGIDADAIPWLGAVDDNFKVVPENVKDIIPAFSVDSLGLIALVKSMNLSGSVFTITLNGAMVTEGATRDMTVEINFAGNIINSINLYNIYTGVTQSEYFDLEIRFNEFTGVTTLADKDAKDADGDFIYKDISGASDLVGALVNTTELNDYTISGDVTFNAVDIIKMTVQVNANVKIQNDKTVYAHISISNIPVIGEIPLVGVINGKKGYDIDNRVFNIYMYENVVYMHRTERERREAIGFIPLGSWQTGEKKLAITMEQFLQDPLKYIMCFGLGFTEDGLVMNAIRESLLIKRPANDPLDYGNILLKYKEESDKSHFVDINLNELTYNENLKNISATISTINNEQTGYKDFLHNLAFTLNIPVSSVNLSLSSKNIQLINIGQEADVSGATSYINSYTYKLGECYVITDGKAVLESNLTYSAYFYNGSEVVRTEQKNAGESLDLSAVSKPDGVVNGVKYSYTFKGWYTDSECKNKFNGVMPVGGIYLFAGFDATAYRNVYFDEQGGNAVDDRYELAGSPIDLVTLENKFVTSGAYTDEYEFVGWLLGDTIVENPYIIPDRDITLVASWRYVGTAVANALLTIVEGNTKSSLRINVGETIDFTAFANVRSSTKFYKDSAFTIANDITVMPEYDLTLYACNEYTIVFSTGTSTSVQSITRYEGVNFTLPTVKRDYYDDGTETCRIEYTFAGWYFADDASTLYNGSLSMPHGGGTLVAKWTEKVRNYVTISFKVNTADSFWTKYTYSAAPASVRWLEGETFYTSTVAIPTAYRNKLFGGTENLTFNGWKVNGTVQPSFVVENDITLEASWS